MLSYSIQKVGSNFDTVEPQGPIDLAGMLRAIDEFPWCEQLRDWNEEQEGPLPALVLESEADQRQLWITALGEGLGQDFQLQSVATQTRKGLFGKSRQDRNVLVFDVFGRSALNQLCALFCEREFDALDHEAQRLARQAEDDED
ncbi:MAG: hypothetical protein LBE30_01210 [Comamonas sp.]|jgi:hypothetical protein|nr:hypothetical protein [Comamonas sp.]